MADADEPLLDARDIQGNIISGFSRAQQYLASFTAGDEGVALASTAHNPGDGAHAS